MSDAAATPVAPQPGAGAARVITGEVRQYGNILLKKGNTA